MQNKNHLNWDFPQRLWVSFSGFKLYGKLHQRFEEKKKKSFLTQYTDYLPYPVISFFFLIAERHLLVGLRLQYMSYMCCFRNRKASTSSFLWNQSLWEMRFSKMYPHGIMKYCTIVKRRNDKICFFGLFLICWLKPVSQQYGANTSDKIKTS